VLDRLPTLAAEPVQLPVDVILVGTNAEIVAAPAPGQVAPLLKEIVPRLCVTSY
jgi:hypothetical protein